jgi:hypothetical protein
MSIFDRTVSQLVPLAAVGFVGFLASPGGESQAGGPSLCTN